MTEGGLPLDATRRARARGAILAAGVVAIIALLELSRGGAYRGVMFAARGTWVGCLLATWWFGKRASGGARDALYVAISVASVVALGVLCAAGGGYTAGPFPFLVTAPLFVAVFLPAERRAVIAAGAASIAGVLAISLAGDARGGVELGLMVVRAAAAAGVALLGASMQDATRREELSLERARVLAEEALARSEARRALAERMAEAGDRAARAAHDMSSPLSSVKANVEWLREELAGDPARADLAEVRVVLDETRACAERLAAEVQGLRAAVRAARHGPPADGPPVADHPHAGERSYGGELSRAGERS